MDFLATLTTVKRPDRIGNIVDCRALVVTEEKKNRIFSKMPDGVRVSACVSLKRDPTMHNNLFKMFQVTVDNLKEGFTLPPDHFQFDANAAGYYAFRQWQKRYLGFIKEIYWMENGELKKEIEVRSLAVDECSTRDFVKFYYASRDLNASLLGMDPIQFERNLYDI